MIIESNELVKNPLVSIIITTYNQENYIRQTIDSIISQSCSFDFEIIIGEDYGTDKTRQICKEYQLKYPKIIKLLLQDENKGMIRNYRNVMDLCRGKYISGCAGDDYWIDNLKLEKQVYYLEKDADCSLVHTSFCIFSESENAFVDNPILSEVDTAFENLIQVNRIAALTCCYRKSVYDLYIQEINPFDKNWLMEDYPFWIWISSRYQIRYIPIKTAVYRILNHSVSNSINPITKQLFEINVNEIREFFAIRENKLDLIKVQLGTFYVEVLLFFYSHSYFGKELKVLKEKLKLYTDFTYLNKIRLWGLTNSFNYALSKIYIVNHKRVAKMFKAFF